jgi:hypothetical protein
MISDTSFHGGGEQAMSRTQGGTLGAVGSVVLVVLGVIALFAANVLVWVDSTLLNSTAFVHAVDRAVDTPESEQRIADVLAERIVESDEVQRQIDDVANRLATRLNENENVPGALQGQLPTDLSFLTRAAQPQIESLISSIVLRVLESDFSGQIRDEVMLTLHSTVIRVLEDRDDAAVQTSGNQLVLDLSNVVGRVFDRLGIDQPARLQQQDFGRVVLVENASGLREASFFVRNSTEIAVAALLLAAALFGVAIFLNRDHRSGILICGYAIAGAGMLTLLVLWGSNMVLESEAGERTVLREVVKSLESNLRLQSLALVLLGVCLIAIADRRMLRMLETGWSKGAATVERFGVSKAVLIAIGAGVVLLVLV